MRKILIAGAGMLLMSAPVFAQSITTETTTKRATTDTVAPPPVIVQPAPNATYEQRSTVTQSGASGESRTDKRSDTYIGADGAVHKNQVIQHEEQR
jgi:hypothetical protein